MIYVDTREVYPVFFDSEKTRNSNTTYLRIDGIHPNKEAGEKLAEMLWDDMVSAGIEQGDACP